MVLLVSSELKTAVMIVHFTVDGLSVHLCIHRKADRQTDRQTYASTHAHTHTRAYG